MAYNDNNRPSYNRGGQGGGYQNRPQNNFQGRPQNGFQQPAAPFAEEIPADYAAAAEKVILANGANISPSKLRNFFGLFCDMYNDVKRTSTAALSPEQVTELTGARIRMIYECGRDNKVKMFVEGTKLINYLMGVGDSAEKFINYYHYFEALVAYHRYNGFK